jgi:isoleucyl-tRNA synthetase
MLELDRWAVSKLNELIEKVMAAYANYEFHVVSHEINDFCVIELSSLYLDIIKDRMYCEAKDSLERRSAQTAVFMILDAMTKMFAPILAFTCDEIWLSMPHRAEDDARNVVLNEMSKPYTEYALSADELAKWDQLVAIRGDVNNVLEAARAAKKIGKSLEAHVTLFAGDAASKEALDKISGMNLAELFIVSGCEIGEGEAAADATVGKGVALPGLTVEVTAAKGEKCQRCWCYHTEVDAETALCPRCAAVVAAL